MKLELKHLAPYLPYGVKCETTNTVGNKGYWTITGFKGDAVHLAGSPYMCDISSIKPLLLLLSEMNEPEHVLKIGYIEWNPRLNEVAYTQSQLDYLFEHHFDFFGLIDAGLALNKNDFKP